ncbi:MAG TPA: hypothetical protein VHS99_12920, partial [Chloroflexota bacterium]|nr:hypothetical protein [Chloroflexota bacterium]
EAADSGLGTRDSGLAEELVAYCRRQLASYKKPRQVVFLKALPRNALGKVQKHLLASELSGPSGTD